MTGASRFLVLALVLLGTACGSGGEPGSEVDAEGGSTESSGSGGDGSGAGGSGSGSPGAAAGTACTASAPWDTASLARSVVGDGTPASCTRDALASAVAKGGYISFNCGSAAKTIAVPSEIVVNRPDTTVVDGGGSVTLDGGGSSRIFKLESWRSLSVRNLTLRNGYSVPPANESPIPYSGGAIVAGYLSKLEVVGSTLRDNRSSGGGAIYIGSAGMLTVVDSSFTGNSSWYGGAILGMLSGLNIVNSSFIGNSAPQSPANEFGMGGAITTDGASLESFSKGGVGSGGTLSLCGVTVKNNSSHSGGGGVWLWAYAPDTISVKNSTFEGNTTKGIGGAGRISLGPTDHTHSGRVITTPGTIAIVGSSFLSNSATEGNGGALYMDCHGDCKVTNSTFHGNSAKGVGAAIQHAGWGSDVGDQATSVRFTNVTFAENANGHSTLFGSKFVLENTLLVSHTTQATCSDPASNSGHDVLQYSAVGAGANCIGSGRVLTTDPLLSPPGDHGGPTYTMLPASGSPLLGAGSACPPLDQRGTNRNTSACDIGAVEVP